MKKKDVKLELEWAERWNADRSRTLEDKVERAYKEAFGRIESIATHLDLELKFSDGNGRYVKKETENK